MNKKFILFALAIVLVQGISLSFFLRADQTGLFGDTEIPDTGTYRNILAAWKTPDLAPPGYRERVLLPAFMEVAGWFSDDPRSVGWLMLPFHGLTAVSIGYLARRLSGREISAWIAGFLYLVFPAGYLYAPEQSTDYLHAQLMMIALALTVAWTNKTGRTLFVLSILFWCLCQLCRPSLFYVFPVLAVLAWPCWLTLQGQTRRVSFALFLLAGIAIPGYWVLSNAQVFGVSTPSLQAAELLHRCVIPASNVLRASERDPSLHFTPLWHHFREIEARENPSYVALSIYDVGPVPENFAANYKSVMSGAKKHIAEYARYVARAMGMELHRQLVSFAPAKRSAPWLHASYSYRFYQLLLLAGILGAAVAAGRRQWLIMLAVLMLVALIMIPASFNWWGGHRMRLPLDLVLLVFAAVALSTRASLAGVAAILLAGVIPVKILGLSSWWLAIGCFAGAGIVYLLVSRQVSTTGNSSTPSALPP